MRSPLNPYDVPPVTEYPFLQEALGEGRREINRLVAEEGDDERDLHARTLYRFEDDEVRALQDEVLNQLEPIAEYIEVEGRRYPAWPHIRYADAGFT